MPVDSVATDTPLLRRVEVSQVQRDERQFFLVKDPRGVSQQALLVAGHFGPFLALADGTRTLTEIVEQGRLISGLDVPAPDLRDLFSQLDQQFMLENDRYRSELARQLGVYRNAEFRVPALEGKSYSDDPDELLDELESFAYGVPTAEVPSGRELKAIVTPHIDFARGGDTYAELWRKAAPELDDVELAVVFGTDHNGVGPRLTLTRQSYATPWNILPTDRDLADKLARILGRDPEVEDHPFADEFNHIHEHSIELASVWLNWAVGDSAVQMLPVLCGSFSQYVVPDGSLREVTPADHPQIADAIGLLQQVARHRRTVFIAAADLAHAGPNFGDPEPFGEVEQEAIERQDRYLLEKVSAGDRDGFLNAVRAAGDATRICGLAPVYMAIWAAGKTDGEWLGYRQCPTDEPGGSFVSIAGALLYAP